MTETRRYNFKLRPTAEQRDELLRQCHMVGDLWNALLERNETNYRLWLAGRRVNSTDWNERGAARAARAWREGMAMRSRLTRFDMSSEWSWLRAECPEWEELSTWTGHRVVYAMSLAFDAFFRRISQGAEGAGYPQFRPRGKQTWLPHRCASGCRLTSVSQPGRKRQTDWALTLKGVPGAIRARGCFPDSPKKMLDADIRLIAGTWWLSIAVEISVDRASGRRPVHIVFDLVDNFATVDGRPVPAWAIGLDDKGLTARIDDAKSRRDQFPRGSDEKRELGALVSRLEARRARRRREALHVWTTLIVDRASALTIVKPAEDLRTETKTGRGNAKEWGAAVETKAVLNKSILDQAPGAAIQMLVYKAAEAGITCEVTAAPGKTAVGAAVVQTTKQVRRASRAAKRLEKVA